jgi:hypothetical protein
VVRDAIRPSLVSTWEAYYGDDWLDRVNAENRPRAANPSPDDLAFLLDGMWSTWSAVFARRFGPTERNLVAELRQELKRWTLGELSSAEDADWVLESCEQLLASFSAMEQAATVRSIRLGTPQQSGASISSDGSTPAPAARSTKQPGPQASHQAEARPRAAAPQVTKAQLAAIPQVKGMALQDALARMRQAGVQTKVVCGTRELTGKELAEGRWVVKNQPADAGQSVQQAEVTLIVRRSWRPTQLARGLRQHTAIWLWAGVLAVSCAIFVPLGIYLAGGPGQEPASTVVQTTASSAVPTGATTAAATTTSTTMLPAEYAALPEVVLRERDRAVGLRVRAEQANSDWEGRLISFAETKAVFADVAAGAEALLAEATAAKPPSTPSSAYTESLRATYVRSLRALVGLAEASSALVPGLEAPDDGSARRAAIAAVIAADRDHRLAAQALLTLARSEAAVPSASEYSADARLISDLWKAYASSWRDGLDSGESFIAAHNYPDWSWSAEDCSAYGRSSGRSDGDRVKISVHADTLTRDRLWQIPAGYPGQGETPRGRLYVMALDYEFRPAGGPTQTAVAEAHVTIIGEEARFFVPCQEGPAVTAEAPVS